LSERPGLGKRHTHYDKYNDQGAFYITTGKLKFYTELEVNILKIMDTKV